jgi:curved DNA-binding protein CbpA
LKNYYQILEINSQANRRQVKAAYYRLALKYHPDRNQNNIEAEEQFKKVNEAYEVLSNDVKKLNYDLGLYRAEPYMRTYHYHYGDPAHSARYVSEDQDLSPTIKRRIQVISGVFFIGLVLFGWYFHNFMNRFSADYHFEEAKILWQRGESTAALAEIFTALRFNKELPKAHILRATIYIEDLNDYQNALFDYESALFYMKKPVADVFYGKGMCHTYLQEYILAVNALTKAILLEHAKGDYYYLRGYAKLKSKAYSYKEICEDFRKAHEFGISDAFSYIKLFCE